ncbi:MAG: DUF177 domain-containing protein [Desulfuromonadales bacterium]|nr:DUF177 domain-containing protein [Desulfuromonadales bacterium]
MRIELKDIKAGELEQEYSCSLADFPDLQELAGVDDLKFYPPFEFKLRLQRSGKFIEVDGQLHAVVRLKCGRCLHHYRLPLAESFSFTFVPQPESCETEEEVELAAADLGLTCYQDDVLELQEPLQEQLLMAIPISPLCDVSCRGLCPECGVNLNVSSCECVKKPFNSKFNILADMNFKKT